MVTGYKALWLTIKLRDLHGVSAKLCKHGIIVVFILFSGQQQCFLDLKSVDNVYLTE